MKNITINNKTLILGIDIAKNKFDVAFKVAYNNKKEYSHKIYEQTLNGYKDFIKDVQKYKNEKELENMIFVMEPTGNYNKNLYNFLNKEGLEVYIANPIAVKRLKPLLDNSNLKTDKKDCLLLCTLLENGILFDYREKEGIYKELENLSCYYEEIDTKLSAETNSLRDKLELVFPEYAQHFYDLHSVTSLNLLKNYVLPSDFIELGEDKLGMLLKDFSRGKSSLNKAIKIIESAKITKAMDKNDQIKKMIIIDQVNRIIELKKTKEELIKIITEKVTEIEYSQKLVSQIKGLNYLSLGLLLAEIGDIRNYRTKGELYKYLGLNLVYSESGKKKGTGLHISKKGNILGRKWLYLITFNLIKSDIAFKTKYNHKKLIDKKPHYLVVTGLMKKFLSVMMCLVKKDVNYEPHLLLQKMGLVCD